MNRLQVWMLTLSLAFPAMAGPQCLTLAFQGNVGGKIEDCGCPKKPLGGLAHRAAMLHELGAGCANTLLVDAGNLMGGVDLEGGRAQTELLLRESRAMGYRVLGVGARELAFGLDFARSVEADYDIHLVSTNLMSGDANAFAPTRVETVGDLRVGFVSVLAASDLPDGLRLQDPREALLHHLPELRARVDVVVLLSNLDRGATRELLETLPEGHGIDFALEGQTRDHWAQPIDVGGTRLLAASAQGKYFGELQLTLVDGRWSGDASFRLHAVEIDGAPDAQVLSRVESFVAERDGLAAAGPGR